MIAAPRERADARPTRARYGAVGFTLVMILVLLVVCYWKGEPTRWRWGD